MPVRVCAALTSKYYLLLRYITMLKVQLLCHVHTEKEIGTRIILSPEHSQMSRGASCSFKTIFKGAATSAN